MSGWEPSDWNSSSSFGGGAEAVGGGAAVRNLYSEIVSWKSSSCRWNAACCLIVVFFFPLRKERDMCVEKHIPWINCNTLAMMMMMAAVCCCC